MQHSLMTEFYHELTILPVGLIAIARISYISLVRKWYVM
jgi:hypothetical protein